MLAFEEEMEVQELEIFILKVVLLVVVEEIFGLKEDILQELQVEILLLQRVIGDQVMLETLV